MNIPGIPPGVDAVRFGHLEPADPPIEFVLGDEGALFPEGFGLIVTMLKDWTAEWDEKYRRYSLVEHFEPRTVTIEVTDSQGLQEAESAKAKVETAGKGSTKEK